MADIFLVLGGTRSGKSGIAERIAAETGSDVLYLATCDPGDEELRERIRRHRERRPPTWTTIEETRDPIGALRKIDSAPSACLLECLSFLVFNWMQDGARNDEVEKRIAELISYMRASRIRFIVVSNDVSGALIPPDAFSRSYQDALGRANQLVAAAADRVLLAVAGIALTLKNGSPPGS